MKSQLAFPIARALNISFVKLPSPFYPTGFDGNAGTSVECILILILNVDDRRINSPSLITDLRNHDVTLGRKFLSYCDISILTKTRSLIWSANFPPSVSFAKDIALDYVLTSRPILFQHELDMERRDAKFDRDERRKNGARMAVLGLKRQGQNEEILISELETYRKSLSNYSPKEELQKEYEKDDKKVSNKLPNQYY